LRAAHGVALYRGTVTLTATTRRAGVGAAAWVLLAALTGCMWPDLDQYAESYCVDHGYRKGSVAYYNCHDAVADRERRRRINVLAGMTDALNASSASMRANTPPPTFGLPATFPAMPGPPPEGVPPMNWSPPPRPIPTPGCIGNVQIPTAVWASTPCP
jgi:hypothetical protein